MCACVLVCVRERTHATVWAELLGLWAELLCVRARVRVSAGGWVGGWVSGWVRVQWLVLGQCPTRATAWAERLGLWAELPRQRVVWAA